MRETAFIRLNEEKWKGYEKILQFPKKSSPDELAELLIVLTDDLAYARTNYPQSVTTKYINSLALKVHQAIYKNKKEEKGRIARFWMYELPLLFRSHHKKLLYSFLIFAVSVMIGALSAAYDDTFVRLIMGDAYVNMTLDNIEKGDPMAVYKDENKTAMFLGITYNNIKVSFFTFIFGVFFSFGTGYILFQNGVMLGAFQYFFYKKSLFLTSVLTIWIHGTLEISAIIIAGCAGMVMGNSILFPGTYTRLESFKHGAKQGIKIVIGLIPVFIMAGFLEGFVTRLTDMHWLLKVGIIGFSAFFIIYYFIIYPIKLNKHEQRKNHLQSGA
ncbi:MAG TPA: stage II sporulation protein M [Cytophagaceae bacterium]